MQRPQLTIEMVRAGERLSHGGKRIDEGPIALGLAGRFEEAVSTLEDGAGMSGRHSLALTALAGVFGQAGRQGEARAVHPD